MRDSITNALSDVLDQLETSVEGESIAVRDVIETLGQTSFASLMLIFALVCASPASAIPGLTAITAVILFSLMIQMFIGRKALWLPGFITRRRMSSDKLCKGIGWLRRPVRFVEGFLKPRLDFLFHRPWFWVTLGLILGLTLFMPFMEVIPMSGSLAAGVIALFAAGLLARDGVLFVVSLVLLTTIPVAIWYFGFSG